MRKLLALLLTLGLSNFVFADENYQFQKGDNLESVLSLLSLPVQPVIYCAEDFEELRIKNCTKDEQKILLDAFDLNYKFLLKIENEVNVYKMRADLQSNKKYTRDLNTISETLSCMKTKMKDTQITCLSEKAIYCNLSNVVAYVNKATMSFNHNINLCREFWTAPNVVGQAAVLLHEISHLCWTTDYEYFHRTGERPSDKKEMKNGTRLTRPNGEPLYPAYAHPKTTYYKDITCSNADHYRYWALNGFCLPGYDCK